ncbi:MAG: hypothetical protein KGL39_56855 [Patescibacteria group bacterium]|nr:hypothetical protein [Patescibacteria group bacterium]
MATKKAHQMHGKGHEGDRGHGHVGGVMNHGTMNHQHGKARKGRVAKPSKTEHGVGGHHPVMGKGKHK